MFITTPIRVLRLLPFSPSSFSAATSSRPALLVRTLITSSFYRPPLAKSPTLRPDWGSELAYRGFAYGNCGFFAARCASSVSSPGILEWNEPVSCSEVGSGQNDNDVEDAKSSVPVRAYLFSTSVDLKSLVEQNKANYIPPSSRMTNYAVFKFGTLSTDPNGFASSLSQSDCSFMVVFHYGSIVLFNIRDQEVDGYLKLVEKHASGLLPEMRKDEYEVKENPTLSTWMEGGLDYIMLQSLNIDSIRTIGSVLGQSIALDYYVRQSLPTLTVRWRKLEHSLWKRKNFSN
uniref:DUF155 domain-containing protein n=1 Tax=Kalanchoe fedtschenkoi TaxID=63787 RepID=A0A7N0V7Z3_KALFE